MTIVTSSPFALIFPYSLANSHVSENTIPVTGTVTVPLFKLTASKNTKATFTASKSKDFRQEAFLVSPKNTTSTCCFTPTMNSSN